MMVEVLLLLCSLSIYSWHVSLYAVTTTTTTTITTTTTTTTYHFRQATIDALPHWTCSLSCSAAASIVVKGLIMVMVYDGRVVRGLHYHIFLHHADKTS